MERLHLGKLLLPLAVLTALALLPAASHAQIFRGHGGGLLRGLGAHCQEASCHDDCEECTCTPYGLNVAYGQHACCGCGCAQCGHDLWCGRGKTPGWIMRNGGILPKCSRAQQWKRYYAGHHGYGPGYGYGGCGAGGCGPGCGGGGSDLFYNYYGPQTGAGGGVATQMYASPHDTPHPAVQTYYTYQPWLPHEFLYEHNRNYMNYHSGPYGRTETHVSWGGSPIIRHTD